MSKIINKMHIPFIKLKELNKSLKGPLNGALNNILNSGEYILGSELEAFEIEFAEFCQASYCVGVSNGLEAISLILRAFNIGPGDEVIVPGNTFIATWLAVTHCGAIPIPVEPDPLTHNINPYKIEEAISSKTKAIIAVHLYGTPAEMDMISDIAKEYNLKVIEDAAQAQGALYKGKRVGSLGDAAATSFYPGKNLGALGDGGAILLNDKETKEKIKLLRNYGAPVKYQHVEIGYNARLDDLQAAFLRIKLGFLDDWNMKRHQIALIYNQKIRNKKFILPTIPNYMQPVWHLYVIRCKMRDKLKLYLDECGISTIIHYPVPPHKQLCYKEYTNYPLEISELLAKEVLSLPIDPFMSMDEVNYIIDALNFFA